MFLPDYVKCPNFVNADLIAQGLAPFEPHAAAIKAGKLVLQQIHEYANQGYALHLFFLWIPSSELAIARIRDRVQEGGHHVPAEDVRRRFVRGISNFFTLYEPLLDSWMLFDNSKAKPVLIAKRRNGNREVVNEELFQIIQRTAR